MRALMAALCAFALVLIATPAGAANDTAWTDTVNSETATKAKKNTSYTWTQDDTDTTQSPEIDVRACDGSQGVGVTVFPSASAACALQLWQALYKGSTGTTAEESRVYAADAGIVNLDGTIEGQVGVYGITNVDYLSVIVSTAAGASETCEVRLSCR